MFICPNCRSKLCKVASEAGQFWSCPVCNGRAVTLPVLQKVIPHKIINELWQDARSCKDVGDRSCPSCDRKMKAVPIADARNPLYLDVCTGCYFIWFDPHELETVAKTKEVLGAQQESSISKAALAKVEYELLQEQQREKLVANDPPDNWWEIIPAFFGLPVEYDEKGIDDKPLITWGLSALMILVYIATFYDLDSIVRMLGLIPADIFRYFGATFVTSTLLHGGLFHLVSNLYFLLVFGDNVEDVLGWRKYLLLFACAALLGDVFHILVDLRATTPVIGASGGISGIIVFYALQFPKTRVGLLLLFRWYRIPVGLMICFWLIAQVFGVLSQVSGYSNVSSLAHLGGATVGFLFWLQSRRSHSIVKKEGQVVASMNSR